MALSRGVHGQMLSVSVTVRQSRVSDDGQLDSLPIWTGLEPATTCIANHDHQLMLLASHDLVTSMGADSIQKSLNSFTFVRQSRIDWSVKIERSSIWLLNTPGGADTRSTNLSYQILEIEISPISLQTPTLEFEPATSQIEVERSFQLSHIV